MTLGKNDLEWCVSSPVAELNVQRKKKSRTSRTISTYLFLAQTHPVKNKKQTTTTKKTMWSLESGELEYSQF